MKNDERRFGVDLRWLSRQTGTRPPRPPLAKGGSHARWICTGRGGFTIVELLVVILVISVLLALALPAIGRARASAQRVQCQNNLRNLAIAVHNHETAHGALPSDGWGWFWLAEPDRGVGIEQPGGWMYQILPLIDAANVRNLGTGLSPAKRRAALSELTQQNLPIFRCPARFAPALGPKSPGFQWVNADTAPEFSRNDYAINAGDLYYADPGGPGSLIAGDDPQYAWPDTSQVTGVCFLRSKIRWVDVKDGLSNTYLIGEKLVNFDDYDGFGDPGYDQCPYMGADVDIHRWTDLPPYPDGLVTDRTRFGSAHAGILFMAMCDGSVRPVNYDIDADVFRRTGNRNDQHK